MVNRLLLVVAFAGFVSSANAQSDGAGALIWLFPFLAYPIMVGFGLLSVSLRSERHHLEFKRVVQDGSKSFYVGLGLLAVLILIGIALIMVSEQIKGQGGNSGLPALFGLATWFGALSIVLMGWGAVATAIGEGMARAFGRSDASTGALVLLGSIVPALIGGVPVIGWALMAYWLCLAAGAWWGGRSNPIPAKTND
ncbi:MAG: hypothetical protein HUU60_00365 [Armatimonadetes bacterium]|nr:hypothetical protein [Armatimonadota bacterium]